MYLLYRGVVLLYIKAGHSFGIEWDGQHSGGMVVLVVLRQSSHDGSDRPFYIVRLDVWMR